MKPNKLLLFFIFVLIAFAGKAQQLQSMPAYVFNKQETSISSSLYVPDSNMIMRFVGNKCYWYTPAGKLLRGPVVIREDGGDVKFARISASGKMIAFYNPGIAFLEEGSVSIFSQDAAELVGSYKLPSRTELDDIHFFGDSILQLYTHYDHYKGNYTWNIERGNVNFQTLDEDSVHTGLYDRSFYQDKIVLAMRHKDSMGVITIQNTDEPKQYFEFFKVSSPAVKIHTRFTRGYPYLIAGDESTRETRIMRLKDTGFVPLASMPLLPDIIATAGTAEHCFILYSDTSNPGKTTLVLFDAMANKRFPLGLKASERSNYVINLHPEKNIVTASHTTTGSIIAWNLSTGEQAWVFNPGNITTKNNTELQTALPDNKLFKVLVKQGSQDVDKTYFNQELNQLYLIKNSDKLITVDAEAKCAIRHELFYKGDNRVTNATLLPGYQYILFEEEHWKKDPTFSRKNYLGETEYDVDGQKTNYLYPYSYKIYRRASSNIVFSLQTKEASQVRIINDSLVCWMADNEHPMDDSLHIYNLNSGQEKVTWPLPDSDIGDYQAAFVNNQIHYLLSLPGNKVALVNEAGKTLYKQSFKDESNYLSSFHFMPNSNFFYTDFKDGKSANQLFSITKDTVQAVRKFSPAIEMLAQKNTASGAYFFYKKEVSNRTGKWYYYRLVNMLNGQDKIVDSVKYDDDNSSVNYEIFPDEHFYIANENNIISWHDLSSGYEFKVFGRDEPSLSSIAYSPDGRYLASANPNGKVLLWDLGTGKETKSLAVEKNGYITKLAFSGDGRYLAASSGDIWDIATGKNVVTVTDGSIWAVNSIAFSRDGQRIISGGACVISWDASDGSKLIFQQEPGKNNMDSSGTCWNPYGCVDPAFAFMVHSTAIHPNSRDFVVGNKKGLVQKWNTENDSLYAAKLFNKIDGQLDDKVYDLQYSRDGKWVIALQQKCLYRLNATTLAIEDSLLLNEGEEVLAIDMGYDGEVFGCITKRKNERLFQLRKLSNLAIQKEFRTDDGSFNKISFSPNKKQAATASDDGLCTIWDLASGRPVMYLNSIGDYGNMMVTPDNFYMASKSALDGVSFFKDSSFYSFDQFDLYLNRPDIVLNRLGYAAPELVAFYRDAYFKRLKKTTGNITDTTVNDYVPILKLANKKKLAVVNTKGSSLLQFQVTDSAAQKGRLRILVNGNTVREQSFANNAGSTIYFEDSILLSQGLNNIEAVYSSHAAVESRKEKVAISYAPAKKIAGNTWFIGVGISRYKDAAMNLKYPVKDIRDIAKDFKKKYPSIIIDTLLDEKASKENILALREKLMKTGINDRVIVSFSGHGLLSDSLNWYFATQETDFQHPELAGLSYEMMEGILKGIPARQKLLLMDACHSGEVDKEASLTFANKETAMQPAVVITNTVNTRGNILINKPKAGLQTSFEMMQDLFANLNNGNGTTVLSAAGGREYALESDQWKNGVFTYSLLKALKDPATDENGNKKISVKELKKAVFNAVVSLTGGRQKPTSRVEILDDWDIW